MRLHLIIVLFFCSCLTYAQSDYYYPPLQGDEWEATAPEELGWCTEELPPLLDFVEETNAKGFLVLYKGRIVIEEYYDDFGQDSAWYWASAGKSLTAFLTGMVQEENLLDINDPTSDYLGQGWTNMSSEQEAAINIRHQLTMCTGMDFTVEDLNCLSPECLNYGQDPDQNWYYHNAPYRLVQDVLENAANQSMSALTFSRLGLNAGITGIWSNYIFFSKPRSMARFGLLNLSRGVWNGNTLLGDTEYLDAMTASSQDSNPAYGYLWWLNGKSTYKLPGFNLSFEGKLIPSAPDDTYAALGANDQKIYVVPSMDLVVVRVGDAADESALALADFDEALWQKLMRLFCMETSLNEVNEPELIGIEPNSVQDNFSISEGQDYDKVQVYNLRGELLKIFNPSETYPVSELPRGLYFVRVFHKNQNIGQGKFIKN